MSNVSPMKPTPGANADAQGTDGQPAGRRRNGRRILLMLLVPLLLAAGAGWVWLSGGRYQATDNAALHRARLVIASDLSGRVTRSRVTDNQPVQAGELLFVVDPEPYRLAASAAETDVAAARLAVEQMKAAYRQALAQEGMARDDMDFQRSELDRQTALADRGVATTATLDQARHAVTKAEEQLVAARQATASARAALGDAPDAPTDDHPRVRAALSALERAQYDLERTTVRAPAAGVVYQASSFREGQYVAAGAPLFALVETQDVWVDANFKETQLAHLRAGQTAQVFFDILPGQSFAAEVEAVGAGTGSEFSVLPAQNATGNWVKVTQRVPVRLRLDAAVPPAAMISGASASVTVDTGVERSLPGLASLRGN